MDAGCENDERMKRWPALFRRASTVAAIVVIAILLHDAFVPTAAQLTTKSAIFAIEEYRAHLSHHVGTVITCRFRPTCSLYGLESVRKYGAFVGGARAAWRILRCGPWTAAGTFDPP